MHQASKILLTAPFFRRKPTNLLNSTNINWRLYEVEKTEAIIVSLFVLTNYFHDIFENITDISKYENFYAAKTWQILKNPSWQHSFAIWHHCTSSLWHDTSLFLYSFLSRCLKSDSYYLLQNKSYASLYLIRTWPEKYKLSRVRLTSGLITWGWD